MRTNYLDNFRKGIIKATDIELAIGLYSVSEIRGAVATGYRVKANKARRATPTIASYLDSVADVLDKGQPINVFGVVLRKDRIDPR